MPTRTRIATIVVALTASAIGFVTPAGSVGTADAGVTPAAAPQSR